MSSQNNKVFSAYTPFRNHLRRAKLIPSLRAIHAHIQHLQFKVDLPYYITNVPHGYKKIETPSDLFNYHLFPWDLEILTKEVILNSAQFGEVKTLENWNYLADSINKLRALKGQISDIYISKNNVLFELNRVSHQQFNWQRVPNHEDLARYWELYSTPKLQRIILKATGLTIDEIYIIGYILIGFYLKYFALAYPYSININLITPELFEKFLKHFCIDLKELKILLKKEQEMNEKFEFAYSSLKAFPLIKTMYENKDAIICPLSPLLYRRLTEGLYYEILHEPGFDEAYGSSFQDLIGKILKLGTDKSNVIPEHVYGKPEKRTVDWILTSQNASIFIECKGKRLTMDAKVSITDRTSINKQLDKMADFILQIYKSILDYKNGLYPQLPYDHSKKIYPLIITAEEWYLFGDELLESLDSIVKNKLVENNLDLNILNTSPYTISSVSGLNLLAQVSKYIDVDELFSEKHLNHQTKMLQLETFITNKYPTEVSKTKDLFKSKYNEVVNRWIKKIKK